METLGLTDGLIEGLIETDGLTDGENEGLLDTLGEVDELGDTDGLGETDGEADVTEKVVPLTLSQSSVVVLYFCKYDWATLKSSLVPSDL